MVTRDDEAAGGRPLLDLDAVAQAGGIPGPRGELGGGGDFDGLRPGGAVGHRAGHPHGARALRRSRGDVFFEIGAEVVRPKDPERAGGFSQRGTGLAAGVGRSVPDDLRRTPCASAGRGAFLHEVDIASVAAAGFAALGKREERAIGGLAHRRDAIRRVAVFAGDEDIDFFQRRFSGNGGGAEHEESGEEAAEEHGR